MDTTNRLMDMFSHRNVCSSTSTILNPILVASVGTTPAWLHLQCSPLKPICSNFVQPFMCCNWYLTWCRPRSRDSFGQRSSRFGSTEPGVPIVDFINRGQHQTAHDCKLVAYVDVVLLGRTPRRSLTAYTASQRRFVVSEYRGQLFAHVCAPCSTCTRRRFTAAFSCLSISIKALGVFCWPGSSARPLGSEVAQSVAGNRSKTE